MLKLDVEKVVGNPAQFGHGRRGYEQGGDTPVLDQDQTPHVTIGPGGMGLDSCFEGAQARGAVVQGKAEMKFPSMWNEERAGKGAGKIGVEASFLPSVGVGPAGPSTGEVPAAVRERKHGASQVENALAVHGFKIHIPSHTGRELDRIGGVRPRSVGPDTADGGGFVESGFHNGFILILMAYSNLLSS